MDAIDLRTLLDNCQNMGALVNGLVIVLFVWFTPLTRHKIEVYLPRDRCFLLY
jgi:hypothetical protein